MHTLTDLKRKLQIGQSLKLVYARGVDKDSPRLNILRFVIKVQTNGVYLNSDKTAKTGSWLEFPKSSLMEMDENGFKTFSPQERQLTPEEKAIIENEPKDAEQEKIDMLSDGSTMFYRHKRYYKEQNAEYLFNGNSKAINGKYRINGRRGEEDKIRDDSLKGEISLQYEFN